MSPLRARMIEDMSLAGLATGTQKIAVQAVHANWPGTTVDRLICSARKEFRSYLLGLRQRWGGTRGYVPDQHGFGLPLFLSPYPRAATWGLFGEKKDRLATTETAA